MNIRTPRFHPLRRMACRVCPLTGHTEEAPQEDLNALLQDLTEGLKALQLTEDLKAPKPEKPPRPEMAPKKSPSMALKKPPSELKTEDTGKEFEMAICLAYGIPYDGPYPYGLEKPSELVPRLRGLFPLFPTLTHTASGGSRYDFTTDNPDEHLSAKSTKEQGKVAPQVIGQPPPEKFCRLLGISERSRDDLKIYIQENIKTILPVLLHYTFDCPAVYYNKKKNTIRYVRLLQNIDWSDKAFTWSNDPTEWNNSSIVKLKNENGEWINLVEFQFLTTRKNMINRWFYENLLTTFRDHFDIRYL